MNELIDEKMKVVLNLIRTNLNADEALKITQAVDNLSRAKCTLNAIDSEYGPKTRTKGGNA